MIIFKEKKEEDKKPSTQNNNNVVIIPDGADSAADESGCGAEEGVAKRIIARKNQHGT